ncbi:Hypothetical predicted protein [Podarcis lilfordi]|uniref:Uncharacterized protein n=1 Tax=Podarcis lilfordi TaxID=74358 RepID=A0AA35P7H9_9SAUR|nr:Hypothetical predicted protein [Podarcis lilfordi]
MCTSLIIQTRDQFGILFLHSEPGLAEMSHLDNKEKTAKSAHAAGSGRRRRRSAPSRRPPRSLSLCSVLLPPPAPFSPRGRKLRRIRPPPPSPARRETPTEEAEDPAGESCSGT